MKPTLYACQLKEIGLPTEGLNCNGNAFPNYISIVNYMDKLTETEKCEFIALITENTFNDGCKHQDYLNMLNE